MNTETIIRSRIFYKLSGEMRNVVRNISNKKIIDQIYIKLDNKIPTTLHMKLQIFSQLLEIERNK